MAAETFDNLSKAIKAAQSVRSKLQAASAQVANEKAKKEQENTANASINAKGRPTK